MTSSTNGFGYNNFESHWNALDQASKAQLIRLGLGGSQKYCLQEEQILLVFKG